MKTEYEIFYNYEDPHKPASGNLYNKFPCGWYIVRETGRRNTEIAAFYEKPDAKSFIKSIEREL